MKQPTWDDIGVFWDNTSRNKRHMYAEEAMDDEDTQDGLVVDFISDLKWCSLPVAIQAIIMDNSCLSDDVFDTMNAE